MSSEVGKKTLSRQELYERVWSTPALQLRKEFGVTDAAIYKACKRYGIPKPPRGYWAKLKHGHSVKKEPLPKATKGREGPIVFERGCLPTTEDEEAGFESAVPESIELPKRNDALHPLAQRTLDKLREGEANRAGIAVSEANDLPHVAVSRELGEKAAMCLHCLIILLEKSGITPSKPGMRGLLFSKDGAALSLSIGENVDKREIEQGDGYFRRVEYSYHPNGWLSFSIDPSGTVEGRLRWNESSRQEVEWIIPQMVKRIRLVIVQLAETNRQYRLRELKRIEAEKRARHPIEIKKHKEQVVTGLERAAYWWSRHREAMAFIEACERRWAHEEGAIAPEKLEWLEWARGEAENLSPFSRGYPETSVDGPVDYDQIPMGGPYPEPTKLPKIPSRTVRTKAVEDDKDDIYAGSDKPYPFWLKNRR